MKTRRIIFAFTLIFLTANAYGQTGGSFAITQSVIASGGGQTSSGDAFSLDGTIGQPFAVDTIENPPFAVSSGFWNFTVAAPTAANASLSGQVRTASGSGIRNVIVRLTNQYGTIRTVQTGSFGYFKFENVEVGGIYIISVSARRYTFSQPNIVRAVQEDITDLEFVADDR